MRKMKNIFKGKVILVTGGTGSIGSEIVRQLLSCEPKTIRIFARHEERHYHLMQELSGHDLKLRFMVGDIRDKERLARAMEGVDIVFHAAAMKHVPLCEYNPFEAVKTNIIGTQNVIDTAWDAGVSHVVGISTDKATEPESVLGVSKLMSEKLFLSTHFYRGKKKTKFTCVRFGNVLGSRGSILPLLKKQIVERREVTVTDPEMTRFVMTIPQAVSLVLRAATFSKAEEIMILKMPATRLGDLIAVAIDFYAPRIGALAQDIKIRVIGKRKGERMHERLLAEHELPSVREIDGMYVVTPREAFDVEPNSETYPATHPALHNREFLSQNAPRLNHKELLALIGEADKHLIQ